MPHSVVITSAKTGPDRAVAGTIANVVNVEFDLAGKRMFVQTDLGPTAPAGDNIKEFDMAVVSAVTFALAAGNWTVTVVS